MEDKMLNNENTQRETVIALIQQKIALEERLIECDQRIIELLNNGSFTIPSDSKSSGRKKRKNTSATNMSHEELAKVVAKHLKNLGMPVNVKGYKYLKEGISMALKNPEMLESYTKNFYPEIATSFKTTYTRVERAIRHAIEVSWERVTPETVEKYFGDAISLQSGKPTNSQLISTLVELIEEEINF